MLSGRLMAEILFVRATPLSSFFPRRSSRVYPALFVLASALLLTSGANADPTFSQYLSAITFTANYAQFHTDVPKALSWRWLPVIFALCGLALNANVVPDPVKYSAGSAFLAVSLVLMPRAPGFMLRWLENPLLLQTGIWSYSIYLWQQPFAKIHGTIDVRLIYLMFALAFALTSFYLVEQPARRFLNERLASRRSRVIA